MMMSWNYGITLGHHVDFIIAYLLDTVKQHYVA